MGRQQTSRLEGRQQFRGRGRLSLFLFCVAQKAAEAAATAAAFFLGVFELHFPREANGFSARHQGALLPPRQRLKASETGEHALARQRRRQHVQSELSSFFLRQEKRKEKQKERREQKRREDRKAKKAKTTKKRKEWRVSGSEWREKWKMSQIRKKGQIEDTSEKRRK